MEELIKKVKEYFPNIDESLLRKAYQFAEVAHADQKRYSGEPYIIHPLSTASILADWKMDQDSIIAALLHDTVEDGAATLEDITKDFGPTVSSLVDGVTKVGHVKLRGSTNEEFVENLRKMFLAMSQDLRVVIIKLADRLHNIRTLQYVPLERRKKIAKETIEVFAPLADRLGMGEVKGELEDLCFPYLYPEDYEWLMKISGLAFKEAQNDVSEAIEKISINLKNEQIESKINGRSKHKYSLYKKLLRPEINREISLVYDLTALRILVNTVAECYASLGIVHGTYRPVPSLGVSDYIAVPKPNGYQSIHTRVFGPGERIIEIQIRTHEMHEEAENGIAAHWNYSQIKLQSLAKSKINERSFVDQKKLAWVKQLASWQKDVTNSEEFLEGLKFDALSERIFILTPKGDVKDLPIGATPIDFAYALHTELGDRTTGAKVNGKIAPFETRLKSGDVCEIMLAKEPRKPNVKWLEFVVTHNAKREINKGLRTPI